ncbi:MAG: FeoB-associated Cys-rich membrane protein [Oscillospiraceae bacterium]|nr:FeoB-associated Cys-rich membrane protein [Oscillospiraceae bacterium]
MNLASWILLIAVLLALVFVLWSMIQKKKRGGSSCGCGSCEGCPMRGNCGSQRKKT